MSLLKSNSVQIGQSATATQNFTLSVPSSPDGTIKLARGNSGATTADVLTVDASGNVTTTLANGSISASKLDGAQTGSAPIFGCRAWVSFDGKRNEADTGASTNGANVKIRASGNVSSVLKHAVGEFTVNFTVPMADNGYAITGTAGGGLDNTNARIIGSGGTTDPTAGSVRVAVTDDAGVLSDMKFSCIAIFR